MKTLKRLSAAVVLTFVLGLSALAGETPAGPCAPPSPGETQAPPCATAQMTQIATLPLSNAGDEYSVSEVAIDLVQYWLAIF